MFCIHVKQAQHLYSSASGSLAGRCRRVNQKRDNIRPDCGMLAQSPNRAHARPFIPTGRIGQYGDSFSADPSQRVSRLFDRRMKIVRKQEARKFRDSRFCEWTERRQALRGAPTNSIFTREVARKVCFASKADAQIVHVKRSEEFETQRLLGRMGMNILEQKRQRIRPDGANCVGGFNLCTRECRQGTGTDAECFAIIEPIQPLREGFSLIDRLLPRRRCEANDTNQERRENNQRDPNNPFPLRTHNAWTGRCNVRAADLYTRFDR